MTSQQEEAVQRSICDKRPEQLRMDFALRSRAAALQLIEGEFGITLHLRSTGKPLARSDVTPKNPIKRACEQSPAAVQDWLENQYPEIAKRAKHEGAEACQMFGGTSRSLKQIVGDGRYSDQAHLTRLIFRQCGLKPSASRRQLRDKTSLFNSVNRP